MKTKKSRKIARKSLIIISSFVFLVGTQVLANNQTDLSQAISAGSLSTDIVDSGGTTVASPAVSFGALSFDFDTQDGTGTLGTASEKIRAYNPTSTETWSVNVAASSTTDVWTDGGSNTYDFNDSSGYTDGGDTDSVGGQMTVDPSSATIAGVSGCATSNVTAGTSDAFDEGTTDSIDLMTAASGAATFCRWDLTGVGLTQNIPASQPAANYSVTLVLTIS